MPAVTAITGPAEALARLAAARDPEAWAWLLEHLGPRMRVVAGRLSDDAAAADDAVQEALLAVRDHARSFVPRAAPDEDAIRWVLRVSANAALQLRRSRRRARARDARGADPITTEGSASADLERDETARLLRDALDGLGEAERAAIVLHVVSGLGYEQVAAELRCPVGTAKTRVHRGLERLRARLGRRQHALSVAALAAALGQDAAPLASSPAWPALLHASTPASAVALPAIGGLTMTAKLALAATAIATLAVPVTVIAQERQSPPVPAPAAAVPAAPVAARATLPPTPRLQETLAQRITFDFADQSMADVASFLGQVTGVTVAIERPDTARPVTLKARDMPVADALAWTAILSRTRLVLDGDAVRFEPAEPGAPLPPGEPLDRAPQAVRDQLAQRMTVTFEGTATSDAIGFITRVTTLSLMLVPGVEGGTPLDLRAEDLAVSEVLDHIAAASGGRWVWLHQALALVPAAGAARPPAQDAAAAVPARGPAEF